MCQTESPESEVGGGVGDTAEAVFNGGYALVNHQLSKVKLGWCEDIKNIFGWRFMFYINVLVYESLF